MPRIKSEEGKIAWYDLFRFLAPIVEKIIKKIKERVVYIPLWYSGIRKYTYHIHSDDNTKDQVRDYLGDDILKKFGFVFGNTEEIGKKVFDVGIYGFLPFLEIVRNYHSKLIGRRKVITVYQNFVKGITSNKYEDIVKAVEDARLLLKFVLEECCDEKFPRLLINKDGDFAKFYRALSSKVKETKKRKRALNRFLRASLRGMYMSSRGFHVLGFSTKPSEMKEEAGRIAAMVGEKAFETVGEIMKIEVGKKIIAIFEPTENKKAVENIFGGPPSVNVLITDPVRFLKLRNLFDAFIGEMDGFNDEVTTIFREKMETHYRVPVIINVFKDNAGILRCVCAAYNIRKGLKTMKKIQQIKHPIERITYNKPEDRFEKGIVKKYHIHGEARLPREPMLPNET